MTPAGWETLAIQAPVVLIFGGLVFFIMREQFKNIASITDKFMQFIDARDKAVNESLRAITATLSAHDKQSSSHDQYVREKLKELTE